MSERIIEIENMQNKVKSMHIFIEGDGDIVLNAMNARNTRALAADDRKTIKEAPNKWEDIITSIHWRDELDCENTYTDCNEEMLKRLLVENAPCISAFGLKKSFGEAVVRNEIDKYATKINNAINIVADRGLIPITFTNYSIDERLMSPKKGSPVLVRLNHFSGWRANFRLDYTDHVYSEQEIANIVNLAGFGLGIGSGRSSGYGRYHIVDIR